MKVIFSALFLSFLLLVKFSYSQKHVTVEEPDALFRDGDRVAFIGNSITHRGLYWSYIMLYYTTRFPERNISFFDLGIGGNVARSLIGRMQSDILKVNPTVATVMIGMNDVASRNTHLSDSLKIKNVPLFFEKYKKDVMNVYDTLKVHTRKLILFTPSIFDQTVKNSTPNAFGANDELYTYGQFIKEIAPKYNATVVDMWSGLMSVNKVMQAKDAAATIIGSDRIHPQAPGSFVMAYEFLKDTRAPQYVSNLAVDAKMNKVVLQNNCTLLALKQANNELSFNLYEKALPVPVSPVFKEALDFVPFTSDFNKEIVQVNHLPKGTYKLLIDQTAVGTYTADELASGINLAVNSLTPQYKQALQVMDLCSKHQQLSTTYRDILYIDFSGFIDKNIDRSNVQACIESIKRAMDKPENKGRKARFEDYIINKPKQGDIFNQVAAVNKQIYTVNQPVQHTYKLLLMN